MQISLDQDWYDCSHFTWGLIEATEGEFLVADGYGDFAFIPISPKFAFYAGEVDQKINRNILIELNKETARRAQEFYFARKISECPITK